MWNISREQATAPTELLRQKLVPYWIGDLSSTGSELGDPELPRARVAAASAGVPTRRRQRYAGQTPGATAPCELRPTEGPTAGAERVPTKAPGAQTAATAAISPVREWSTAASVGSS